MAYRTFHGECVGIAATHPRNIIQELASLQKRLLEVNDILPRDQYDAVMASLTEPVAAVAVAPVEDEAATEGEEGEAAPAPEEAVAEESGEEENLWAVFGIVYDPKAEAELALDAEQEGLEAAARAKEPVDPCHLKTEGGAVYQLVTVEEQAAMERQRGAAARAKEAEEAAAAAAAAAEAEAAATKGKGGKGKEVAKEEEVAPAPAPEQAAAPSMTREERADRCGLRQPAWPPPVATAARPSQVTVCCLPPPSH